VVPVKALAKAKTRLAPLLSPQERQRLALFMLGDLLDKLRNIPEITGIIVVTPDPEIANLSKRKGASVEWSRNRDA